MNQYVLYAILSGCLAGTNGMLGRILTEGGMSSTEIGACRFAITTVLYFVISIRVGAFVLKIRWKNLWIFLGTGAVGQLLYSTLFFTAVNIMPIFVVSTISITWSFFVILLAWIFSGEPYGAETSGRSAGVWRLCAVLRGSQRNASAAEGRSSGAGERAELLHIQHLQPYRHTERVYAQDDQLLYMAFRFRRQPAVLASGPAVRTYG